MFPVVMLLKVLFRWLCWCLGLPFGWPSNWYNFSLCLCVYLPVRYVLRDQREWALFSVQSPSLCLLIGKLRLFTSKVIIGRCLPIPIIFRLSFWLVKLSLSFLSLLLVLQALWTCCIELERFFPSCPLFLFFS